MVSLSQTVNDGVIRGKVVIGQNRSIAAAIETVPGTLREETDILLSVFQRYVLSRYATNDGPTEVPR
jgi:hypothetical protein